MWNPLLVRYNICSWPHSCFFLSNKVLEALENGVSQWPKLEGRFPQVRYGTVRQGCRTRRQRQTCTVHVESRKEDRPFVTGQAARNNRRLHRFRTRFGQFPPPGVRHQPRAESLGNTATRHSASRALPRPSSNPYVRPPHNTRVRFGVQSAATLCHLRFSPARPPRPYHFPTPLTRVNHTPTPPQVSGIRFSFDPSQPPGRRIVPGSAHTTGPLGAHGAPRPLDPQRSYRVATKEYLAQGKDGYDVFAVGVC